VPEVELDRSLVRESMQVHTSPLESQSESPVLVPAAQAKAKEACRECGKLFSRRGLAGHMRLKHGIQAVPKSALPAEVPGLAKALTAMTAALARIEARLSSLEELASAQASGQAPELAAELREVLAKIDKYRSAAPEEDAIACAARFRRLGLLRRRQAELLYELGTEGAVTPDELLGA
jgi:hypothetical protein